ncbi:hypothetical protein BDN71DRAFT_1587123 [Pleurotus eryngii]|uniref:DH domain-containing protein n=1 Tax=Pleurotus eryngii TaxID=5323 RepID=A0A9P6DJB4_PLEER|nr:hypothetical protein BDN71DRAFT_1587123 [Pleurotus eryngii]
MFSGTSSLFFAVVASTSFAAAMPGGAPPTKTATPLKTVTVAKTAIITATAIPATQCNTGSVQCCNSVEKANSTNCSSISPTCDVPPTSPLTPPLDAIHQHRSQDTAKKRLRRWTLAAAMTDSSITDEAFVEGLEKVRMAAEIWEWRESASATSSIPQLPVLPQRSPISDIPVGDGNSDHAKEELVSTQRRRSQPKFPIRSTSDPSSAQTWQMARRALLICREIVRTERNYLASLHILVDGGAITTPPAHMLTLLQPLVQISTVILKKMERNPSALGVAEAFVSCQEDLESALVAWCSSVGDFFGLYQSTSNTLGTIVGPLKRKFNVWKRVKAARRDWDTSLQRKAHITIGDLAILPTQRILRYVLLYKDLLRSTHHSSPSYTWVMLAAQASERIARKCDNAQLNKLFIR